MEDGGWRWHSSSLKQNAVNTCSSNCTLWTFEDLSNKCSWIICCNYWQYPPSLSWIGGEPAQAISCINSCVEILRCIKLKCNLTVGQCPRNIDSLLKFLWLLLNQTICLFSFALLVLLDKWRKKFAVCFTILLLSWTTKGVWPFLSWQKVVSKVMQCHRITMNIHGQQIMELIDDFSPKLTSPGTLIALKWMKGWWRTSLSGLFCHRITCSKSSVQNMCGWRWIVAVLLSWADASSTSTTNKGLSGFGSPISNLRVICTNSFKLSIQFFFQANINCFLVLITEKKRIRTFCLTIHQKKTTYHRFSYTARYLCQQQNNRWTTWDKTLTV